MYGLEYGSKCFCGDDTSDFEVYGVTATGCDTPCVGDPTVSCGEYRLSFVWIMARLDQCGF